MITPKRILIAPLDWGLGHATRCIPIIRALLAKGVQVFIASNGASLLLLQQEFPDLGFFEIAGYDPVYSTGNSMVNEITQQLPKFVKAMAQEQEEVEEIIKKHKIDVLISDNRYGAYSKKIKSIFITHQLNILMPGSLKLMERVVNHYNHKQIKEFSECWVPAPNASLVKPLFKEVKGVKTRFIGNLSRFEKRTAKKKYDILVICSGPPPQKQIFETLLIEQLQNSDLKSLIVRGEPERNKTQKVKNMTVCDFMNADQLNDAIAESELIISRSGYSTVMDLQQMGKKAIFIATPGQTEQEYLAKELMSREIAFAMKQDSFDLQKALIESADYSGFMNFEQDEAPLHNAIQSIL